MEEMKAVLDELHRVHETFKSYNDAAETERQKYGAELGEIKERVERTQDALDQLEVKLQRPGAPATEAKEDKSVLERAVSKFMRSGERGLTPEEAKALSTVVDADGGYLVPENMLPGIVRLNREFSPVRSLASVFSINQGNSLKVPKQGSTHFTAGWVAELGARTAGTSGTFAQVEILAHEMYALQQVSQGLLDSASFPIESWVSEQVGVTFSQTEATAFVSGNGVGRPLGLLDAAAGIGTTNSGNANLLTPDGLMATFYALAEPYAANATWMAARATIRAIRQMKDGMQQYLWQPGLQASEPATLLGRPIVEATDMPAVSAGLYPVIVGDFRRGYYIVDHVGIRLLRDPYSSKPYVEYYFTKKVGGAPVLAEAFRICVVSA